MRANRPGLQRWILPPAARLLRSGPWHRRWHPGVLSLEKQEELLAR